MRQVVEILCVCVNNSCDYTLHLAMNDPEHKYHGHSYSYTIELRNIWYYAEAICYCDGSKLKVAVPKYQTSYENAEKLIIELARKRIDNYIENNT